jgi:hypothetical protein
MVFVLFCRQTRRNAETASIVHQTRHLVVHLEEESQRNALTLMEQTFGGPKYLFAPWPIAIGFANQQ